MSNCAASARPRCRRALGVTRRGTSAIALAAAAWATMAGPAAAHGGDTSLVHSCVDNAGNVKIIAANATCTKNEVPLDWSRGGGAGTTYSAGAGLSLSPANVFSVTGAPWAGLTGVPTGFADGTDDDGSAAVSALSTTLGQDDGVPNESTDPVSFSKIKDLTTMSGDGRITGAFIRDLTVSRADLADDAVNGDKIADGSIEARHLAPGVLDRTVTTTSVDPPSIPAGSRMSVDVPLPGVTTGDIVTVSPPALLEDDLLFVGSDVRSDGAVTIYLYNPTAGAIDGGTQTWTIRQLHTGGA